MTFSPPSQLFFIVEVLPDPDKQINILEIYNDHVGAVKGAAQWSKHPDLRGQVALMSSKLLQSGGWQ